MFKFLSLKPEAFGLDISDLSLKIIKLRKKKGVLSLASFGEAKLKPGIIEGGEIKNEEAVIEIIKDTISKVKGEKLRTNYVVASLPEEKAFLQVIQMPIMKEEELKKAVYFEAENYIPLPVSEVYLDSQIIKPLYNHLDHLDVLIAAQSKKTIDSYLSCFKKAGLFPKVLEIESQAFTRALVKNEVSLSPLLLIDLGATRTSFIIFSSYSLRFTSSIPSSSSNFTEAISQNLKIDFDKAEELKLKYGLKEKRIFEAVFLLLIKSVNQIKDILSYYHTHIHHEHLPPGENEVERILLSGGGASLKGLTDFLSSELKISVEVANPWVNILPESLKEVPELPFEKSLSFTTALGLALRGIKEYD